MEPKKTVKEVNRSETQKNRVNWQISGRSTAAHMPVDRKNLHGAGFEKTLWPVDRTKPGGRPDRDFWVSCFVLDSVLTGIPDSFGLVYLQDCHPRLHIYK